MINRVTGDWGINNSALGQMNRQATTLAKCIAGGCAIAEFRGRRTRWLTRWRAGSNPWLERPWSRREQTGGAAVATALADQIARLNQVGKMSAKRGAGTAESVAANSFRGSQVSRKMLFAHSPEH